MSSGIRMLVRRVLLLMAILSVCAAAEMVMDTATQETAIASQQK